MRPLPLPLPLLLVLLLALPAGAAATHRHQHQQHRPASFLAPRPTATPQQSINKRRPHFKPTITMAAAAAPVSTTGPIPLAIPNPATGVQLAGILDVKDPASNAIMVICHGLCSSKETGIIRALGESVVGHNTYRFDFAGNGDSGGEFRYTGYEAEVGDLRAVVEALRAQGWLVDCVLGHSKGAHIVLRYAATHGDVPKVFSLAARFDFGNQPKSRFTDEQRQALQEQGFFLWNVRGKDYKVTRQDFEERDKTDMAPIVDAIRTSPHRPFLLLAHGDADETIPVEDAGKIAARLEPGRHRVVIFPGADHFFRRPEDVQQVVDAATAFLKEGIPSS